MQRRSFLRWHTFLVGGARRGRSWHFHFEMRWGAVGKGVGIYLAWRGNLKQWLLYWSEKGSVGEVNMEHLGGILWISISFLERR